MELAGQLLRRADCLVAMTDAQHDWAVLPQPSDLRVINKIDLPQGGEVRAGDGPALRISALTGEGVGDLVTAVRDCLVPPADLEHPGPWVFDERL